MAAPELAVRVMEDADYERLRQLSDGAAGWSQAYESKAARVWTRPAANCRFHMIKVRGDWADVEASVVYNVLHEADFRKTWDSHMIEQHELGLLNPNNDVCYYALRGQPPVRNRDFVIQRSWLDLGDEKFILSHSVCHDDYPPRKGFIRAVSYFTGYYIRATGACSCQVTYVTNCDPKGRLPSWVVNRITHLVSPKAMKRLHGACELYPAWKAAHRPWWRPWSRDEQQMSVGRVDVRKCSAYRPADDCCDDDDALDGEPLADADDDADD